MAFGKYLSLALLLFAGAGLAGCAKTWVRQPTEKRFRGSLEGSFRYGNITGFLQIPNGGKPGTTSNKRPTFDELDIQRASIGDTQLTVGYGDHSLFAGARFVRLSGDSVLKTDLISQGVTFPAGSSVDSHTQLDWYRFGYQHRFSFRYRANDQSAFSVDPAVGAVLLAFDYELDGANALSADRTFSKAAPMLGVRTEWAPSEFPFSLSWSFLSSLPFSTLPFILSVQLTAHYQIWGQRDRGGSVFLGVGYDRIKYTDDQEVPNQIDAELGPMVIVGLSLAI